MKKLKVDRLMKKDLCLSLTVFAVAAVIGAAGGSNAGSATGTPAGSIQDQPAGSAGGYLQGINQGVDAGTPTGMPAGTTPAASLPPAQDLPHPKSEP
jgi:hypothetical protein